MKTVEVDVEGEAPKDPKKASAAQKLLTEAYTDTASLPHNYKMSHDNTKFATFTDDGVMLYKDGQKYPIKATLYTYELVWSPSNKYFAFVTVQEEGEAIIVVDTRADAPVAKEHYKLASPGIIRGIEWSPRGNELYWIEQTNVKAINNLKRMRIGQRVPKTLVETTNAIDFFMPPVTWFEHGQGPTNKDYSIVYGTYEGLFLVSRDGKTRRRLFEAPATGVNNLEWAPNGNMILMYFNKSFKTKSAGELRGVMLAHLDEKDPKKVMESLYDGKGVHTLWFSADGKYVTWAKESNVWYRRPGDVGKKGTKVPAPIIEVDGEKVAVQGKAIKGCVWNESSTRLAITAGNQVWIFDVNKNETTIYHEFGTESAHFTADPRWKDNRLILTIYEDMEITGREKPSRFAAKGKGKSDSSSEKPKRVSKKSFLDDYRKRRKKKAKK